MAWSINNKGQVVGLSYVDAHNWHAFLWERGKAMKDLGTLGGSKSYAFDINNEGQVVGTSLTDTGDWHAFLWQNDHMIGLFSRKYDGNCDDAQPATSGPDAAALASKNTSSA